MHQSYCQDAQAAYPPTQSQRQGVLLYPRETSGQKKTYQTPAWQQAGKRYNTYQAQRKEIVQDSEAVWVVGLGRVDEVMITGAQREKNERPTQQGETQKKVSLLLFCLAALLARLSQFRQRGFLGIMIDNLVGSFLSAPETGHASIHYFIPSPAWANLPKP